MAGKKLADLGFTSEKKVEHVSVKESVLPFTRFSGVDIILGPEMKSTGEVMGVDDSFSKAFVKSQEAAGQGLPARGAVFVSVRNEDKRGVIFIAKELVDLGFDLAATAGTWKVLRSNSIEARKVGKISEGDPEILDLIRKGEIKLIINTPSGRSGQSDSKPIRSLAVMHGVPCITTLQGAQAAVSGMGARVKGGLGVKSIQEYHKGVKG
jgi:carbamoyl-phosphate synthase large subunit